MCVPENFKNNRVFRKKTLRKMEILIPPKPGCCFVRSENAHM